MSEIQGERKSLVILNIDLFFGIRLKQIGGELGYATELVPTSQAFIARLADDSVALGIIDIGANPDWAAITTALASGETLAPVLAFGAHMNVEGLRAAKEAGVVRVISNGDFHRDPVKVIQRYAGFEQPVVIVSE